MVNESENETVAGGSTTSEAALIGYVSDENYVALPNVALVFTGEDGGRVVATRSWANGAVYAVLTEGVYRVVLAKRGFGSKTVQIRVGLDTPYQFRLLSDGLLGYAWPKWVKGGQPAEFRVHSPEAYKLGLWRYGYQKELVRNLGWFDDHGPRTTIQITPDGDYTRSGMKWNQTGYQLRWHQQRVEAPARPGLYFFHARTVSGSFFTFPWIVAPAQPQANIAVLTSNITWNAYNSFGGRSNYVNQDGLPPQPTINARQDLKRFNQPDVWPYTETAAPLSFERPEPFNQYSGSGEDHGSG